MGMGNILQIAGQVIKIGGAIGGSIAAKRAERRMRRRNDKLMNDMRNREQSNFESQYYADATMTADNQRNFTNMRNYLRDRRAEQSGLQGVGMGTSESMAAQKAADNDVVAQTYSTVAANAAEKKDMLRQNHVAAQESYDQIGITNNKEHFQNRLQQIKNGVKIANDTGDALIEYGAKENGGKQMFATEWQKNQNKS